MADRRGAGALSKLAMGRLAAVLYLVSGVVTLVSPLVPSAPDVNRIGIMAVGLVAIALAPAVWVLPWDRWPRGASLWTAAVVAQVLIGTHNYFGGADPYRYGLFFMVSYIWVGLAQPRWSSVKLSPVTTVAYLLPLVSAGHPDWARLSAVYAIPVFVLAGEATAWVAEGLRGAQDSLSRQAFHDGLTQLPNRVLFQLEVESALRTPATAGALAVFFVDLDRFKSVNDTLGHDAGDELLCQVAERLRGAVRGGDMVARMGGDEFTVLVHSVADLREAEAVATRLLSCFVAPYDIGGTSIQISASVGVALGDEDCADIEALIRNSDLAMYLAKDAGGRAFRFFDSTLGTETQARREVERELREGIARGELRVVYQPIVELATERVIGCEALVRWQHPARGLLPPADFLPVAEESGLITTIDEWVTGAAIAQAAEWSATLGDRAPSVSVNLSARDLERPGYAASVAAKLAAAGLAAEKLVLEITEGIMLRPASTRVLHELRAAGITVAIDDFGTGYSSLAYLKELPAAQLKLDRRFIAGLGSASADDAIANSVITLARTLGMTVTAEGVERPEQASTLVALGCPAAQGFLFSRPVPAAEVARLLSAQPAPTA